MSAPLDLTGHVFGLLRCLRVKRKPSGERAWLCECACGTKTVVAARTLRYGASTSCGCRKLAQLVAFNSATKTKHGRAGNRNGKKPERLYVTWFAMINRCYCKSAGNYRDYGAKGVRVCARWRTSFATFARDVGEHPGDGFSIDRINPFGDYEPSNVRWATARQQANNRRRHHATRG